MPGSSGHVQTVSIIDTISELQRGVAQLGGQGPKELGGPSRPKPGPRGSSPGGVARPPALSLPGPNMHKARAQANGARAPPPPLPRLPRMAGVLGNSSLTTSISVGSLQSLQSLPSYSFTDFQDGGAGEAGGPQGSSTLRVNTPLELRKRRGRRAGPGRGQSETPDWIRELFQWARKGELDRLKEALADMESALIRNLTDHLGNNLLHVVCRQGHTSLLPWLAARLGHELEQALGDENKQGLTPTVLAIKHGRSCCVSWLVTRTRARERLQAREGERSLLHSAAKYGQDGISGWLCEEMAGEGLVLDQMDVSGNTPLHLAARSGKTATAATLLNMGASVAMKNDMGLKSSDCASIRGHTATAEFLLMFETSLGITRDLLARERSQDAVVSENGELKTNFRDVLSVSKKLTKEREEMCRELGRLHESMIELHDKMILEMQVMCKENAGLRGGEADDRTLDLDSTITACDRLHSQWQQHQRQYFSSSLADCEHRIMIAEDGLNRARGRVGAPDIEPSYTHRSFRDRLEEVRSQSSSLTSGAPQLLPSAPSSTCSSPHQSEDQDELATQLSEDTNFYEAMQSPDQGAPSARSQRQKLATPSPGGRSRREGEVYSSLSSAMYSTIGSPEKAMIVRDPSPSLDSADSPLSVRHTSLDYHRAKLTASELARSSLASTPTRNGGGKDERRRSRADLKKRLRQLALTSETGSASVIEVIEPNSSEEEEFKKSMQEMNISWSRGPVESRARTSHPSPSPSKSSDSTLSGSRGSRTGSLEMRHQSLPPTTRKPPEQQQTPNIPTRQSPSSTAIHRLNIPAVFSNSNNNEAMPQAFLTSSTKIMGSKNLLTSEPDLLSGIKGARQDSRPDSLPQDDTNDPNEETLEDEELLIDDFGDEFYNEDFSDVQMLPYDLESERSESSLQIKKKGFLQKLSLSKWTNKKAVKSKPGSKGKELAPEYFRETYVHPRADSSREGEDTDTLVESPVSGVTTITVGQEESGEEDGLDTRLSKSLSPSSRKSSYYTKTTEGLSVATSDDSGILTSRPMSSASKSETSLSRPDSSTSEPPGRKSLSGSQDALETPSLETRVQPMGAEQSSPSTSSEIRLNPIEEGRESARQRATIITLHSSPANINGLPEPNNNLAKRSAQGGVRKSSTVRSRGGKNVHVEEKPWYDVSDDEVDMSAPDHITSIISVRGSSDEELHY